MVPEGFFQPIRVATWNIGGGLVMGENGRYEQPNLAYFAAELEKVDCDVVCLQEAHLPIADDEVSQVAELSTRLGFACYVSHPCDVVNPSHLRGDQYLALAVLSKHEIVASNYHALTNPNLTTVGSQGVRWVSHDKGYLRTTLAVQGTLIEVVTGHNLPFGAFKRDLLEPEFAPIRGEIEDVVLASAAEHPTIITADMNTEAVEQLLPRLFAAGFTQALPPVATVPAGKQLDHMLYSHEWHCLASNVVEGIADHYLCYADLALQITNNE